MHPPPCVVFGRASMDRSTVDKPLPMLTILEEWQQKAGKLKTELYAIYLAYRDKRTPLYAKVFSAIVVGYAFSPIDLIPDFIPVLGYLDDLVLIPLGIKIALWMIPPEVMAESRESARQILAQKKTVNYFAAVIILSVWLSLIILTIVWLRRMLATPEQSQGRLFTLPYRTIRY